MPTVGTQYGAMVHGARSVEGGLVVALVAVQGDLASPSLESLKGAFARVASVTADAAVTVATAAPPPPYASGVDVDQIAARGLRRAVLAAEPTAQHLSGR